jgi:membrane-associated phospholipid phosphatase
MYSRDGIAGLWQPPAQPVNLLQEDPENLRRWSPWVRASILDFELVSRIGFSAEDENQDPRHMTFWHLQATPPGVVGDPPDTAYFPLVRFIRPPDATFRAQMALVNNYADIRQDRIAEIISELGGGGAFLASVAYLHPDRTRWTIELLLAVFRLSNFVEMRIKHALACRRPIEYSPQIQPIIQTPAHGALPSGHATESFAMALVLWEVLKAGGALAGAGTAPVYNQPIVGTQLMRCAARIAINRVAAGVHTLVETAAGATFGLTLGQYFVNRCTQAASYQAWLFDGNSFPGNGDFLWDDLYDVAAPAQTPTPYAVQLPDPPNGSLDAPSEILSWMWDRAIEEWQ